MDLAKFQSIFSADTANLGGAITIPEILASLILSFILAMFIFYIYKKTYSGTLYSKNFNITLVFTSMVVTVIMMAIGKNLALSLGLIGALSIIRFRSAIKDPKDITFIFWAVSIGLVNGVHLYQLSIVSSLFIGLILILFSNRLVINHPYLITISFTKINEEEIDSVCNKYCRKHFIRNRTISDKEGDFTIEVLVKNKSQNILLQELKKVSGVKKVMMFSHTGELSE